MWLEAMVTRPAKGQPVPAIVAPPASTTESARTDPSSVKAIAPPGPSSTAWTALRSNIRAPASSRASRSPKASRAGWTVAASR